MHAHDGDCAARRAELREAWTALLGGASPDDDSLIPLARVNALLSSMGFEGGARPDGVVVGPSPPAPDEAFRRFLLPGAPPFPGDASRFARDGALTFRGALHVVACRTRAYDGPCCELCGAAPSTRARWDGAYECRAPRDPDLCAALGRRLGASAGEDPVAVARVYDGLRCLAAGAACDRAEVERALRRRTDGAERVPARDACTALVELVRDGVHAGESGPGFVS